MSQETVKAEEEGISVVINGQMEIEEVNITGEVNSEMIKQCVNNGLKKMQQKVVELLQ